MLGITPKQGRTIQEDEDRAGSGAAVVLISEGLWSRRYGADPGMIGKAVRLNDRAFTVIGILPACFRGLSDGAEIWAPFGASGPPESFANRGSRGFPGLAKLKAGVSLEQAQSEMDGISKRLEAAYPATNEKRSVEVARLDRETVGPLRLPLLLLLGAVSLVLLIACTNVANLLLARSEARRQEMAIRVALGAGRWRIFRQLMTESLMLSVLGTLLGVAFSLWAVDLLTKTSPISLPTYVNPKPDWTVALFAAGVSILAGLFAGLMPAFQGGSKEVHDTLKDSSSRTGGQVAQKRFRSALVVSEVAIAMTLLVGAGLLMRSFRNLTQLQPGFEPQGMLTMLATLPRAPAPAQGAEADGP
jgi:predicted permease